MASSTPSGTPQTTTDFRGLFAAEAGSWIPLAIFGALLAMVLGQVLSFNGGVLVYDMDDPYIGYALSEEIARGNYGINPGESSSPASTLLWPFILAPFILLRGGIWVPLLINVASVLLAVHVVYGSLARTFRGAGAGAWRPVATAGALFAVVLFNLVFVTFAGMEHGPQILLAVVVTAGLVAASQSQDRGPSRWLLAALWLGPLIRFEMLALTVPALVLLWRWGHTKQAVIVAVGAAVPIAAFVAFLTANGVGPLPSSLMVRSPELALGSPLYGVMANAWRNVVGVHGTVMAILVLPVVGAAFQRERPPAERWLSGWLVAVIVLHFAFGRFGHWGRYEAYAWASALVLEPYLFRRSLLSWARSVGPTAATVVAGLFAFVVGWSYASDAMKTPLATNDIYIEHREMNRLVTDFVQGPVAVNDVGYVAFQNDAYVLDLFGLTSQEVYEMRGSAGDDVSWMETLVRRHDVDLVMVYLGPYWFERFPATWTPLGSLQIMRLKALSQQREVAIFATRAAVVSDLRSKLIAWGEGLPEGARLMLLEEG